MSYGLINHNPLPAVEESPEFLLVGRVSTTRHTSQHSDPPGPPISAPERLLVLCRVCGIYMWSLSRQGMLHKQEEGFPLIKARDSPDWLNSGEGVVVNKLQQETHDWSAEEEER